MMKANKKVMAALLAAMMTVSAGAAVVNAAEIVAGPGSTTVTTTTGKWYREPVKVGNNWVYRYSYQNSDGTFAKLQWKLLDGKWYFFDSEGYALSEEYNTDNGVVKGDRLGYTDVYKDAYFRFDKNCAMVTGWYQRTDSASDPTQSVGNGWEYYNTNGVRQYGWVKDGANWFCIVPLVGTTENGETNPNVTDSKGNPVKEGTLLMNGTYTVYGVKYTFAANGVMKNQGQGWVKDGDRWYYINENNQYATYWNEINGKWYYLAQSDFAQLGGMKDVKAGQMLTGWQYLQTSNTDLTPAWFYFTANGDLVMNNWIQTNGDWYLTNASGKMLTGWVVRGGKTYYLNTGYFTNLNYGAMATGTVKIDNNTYTFDNSGALVSINGNTVAPGYVPSDVK